MDIIEEKYVDAAEKYREVLRIVSEYKGKVKTDTLQQLHTGNKLSHSKALNGAVVGTYLVGKVITPRASIPAKLSKPIFTDLQTPSYIRFSQKFEFHNFLN